MVENAATNMLQERPPKVSEHEQIIKLEKLKLKCLKAKLELANIKISNGVENDVSGNLENLIKIMRTLTISVPTKQETFSVFFSSINKSFRTKKVSEE